MTGTSGIKILYEDNHILCAVKPRGALSQADDTGAADMLTALKRYLAAKYGKPGAVYLGLVHRLDRPVGGVMVFARTSKAAARLSELVREHRIRRIYYAVVHGELPAPAAETDAVRLEHLLRKNGRANLAEVCEYSSDADLTAAGWSRAALDYRLVGVSRVKSSADTVGGAPVSLARVELITGKPHQIRAQFAHIGHPVVGDRKYGTGNAAVRVDWHLRPRWPSLWAAALTFEHPVKRETVYITAPPPAEPPWDAFAAELYNNIE